MANSGMAGIRTGGAHALGLVLTASLGVQLSALIAHSMFARLGPMGVSGLRFAVAGAIACALVRPRWRGRTPTQWLSIGCFGSSIASMNLFLYLALDRLPFGVALTLEFLGPFAVAVIGARRPAAVLLPVVGFVGVVIVVRPSGELDAAGIVFAMLAAGSLAAYTVLAERVGRQQSGFSGLALALVVAAVLTSPFAIAALPSVTPLDVGLTGICAVLGVIVAFAADFLAVRVTSARAVAVMLSFDPVLAALLGLLMLGQSLDMATWLGIALVAIAGGASAALAGVPRTSPLMILQRPWVTRGGGADGAYRRPQPRT